MMMIYFVVLGTVFTVCVSLYAFTEGNVDEAA